MCCWLIYKKNKRFINRLGKYKSQINRLGVIEEGSGDYDEGYNSWSVFMIVGFVVKSGEIIIGFWNES